MKRLGYGFVVMAVLGLGMVRAASGGLSAEDERVVEALPVVPPGLNGHDALLIKPAANVTATYTYTVSAPDLTAKEWVMLVPRPPELPGQKISSVRTLPASRLVADLGPLKRPLLRVRVSADTAALAKGITLEARYQATLYSRQLIRRGDGDGMPAAPALLESERRLFLRRTSQFDYTNDVLWHWLTSNRLTRGEREGEVDFARRVFQVIAKGFHYEYLGQQDRSAPHVCVVGKSDCGGMAVLFVTALRAQGIPARALAGRWAKSAVKDDKIGAIPYYQEHVKAEFFAQGVGWVPVDLSSAVLHDKSPDKLAFFGNEHGDFITLHLDNDVSLDSLNFGIQVMPWLQDAAYWVTGAGNLNHTTISQVWTVTNRSIR